MQALVCTIQVILALVGQLRQALGDLLVCSCFKLQQTVTQLFDIALRNTRA